MKVVLALVCIAAAASAVELDGSNFDEGIAGKAAFVKFLAPWCGHCKRMKPAWDQLSDAFKDSKTAVIVDVDCTKDNNRALCGKYGVQGYPTIKYITGSTDPLGDKYEGGRDFESLKKFADENLGPSCGPDNMDLCNDDQRAEIEKYQAMSEEDRNQELKDREKKIEDAEETFKNEVQKLQDKYQELMKEKDDAIAAASPPLRIIRSVINAGKSADSAKDEL